MNQSIALQCPSFIQHLTFRNCFSSVSSSIPNRGSSLILKLDTNACEGSETQVDYLEHVQAVVTLNATRRGDVQIFLSSPMGTR